MTMSFRRNTDTSLPASHNRGIDLHPAAGFRRRRRRQRAGHSDESNEQARGTPLAGLAVKVTDGFFLVGLSNVDADRQRNLQLLKERSWFDVPLVYVNQRRAIIAIERARPVNARSTTRSRRGGSSDSFLRRFWLPGAAIYRNRKAIRPDDSSFANLTNRHPRCLRAEDFRRAKHGL